MRGVDDVALHMRKSLETKPGDLVVDVEMLNPELLVAELMMLYMYM